MLMVRGPLIKILLNVSFHHIRFSYQFVRECKLDKIQLPTNLNVLGFYENLRVSAFENDQNPPNDEIFETIREELIKIWSPLKIPLLSQERIKFLIKTLHKTYKKEKNATWRLNEKDIENIEIFLMVHDNIRFNIAHCKCKSIEICKCRTNKKQSKEMFRFIQDQKKERYMTIFDGIDIISEGYNVVNNLVTEAVNENQNINRNNEIGDRNEDVVEDDDDENYDDFVQEMRSDDSASDSENGDGYDSDPDYKPSVGETDDLQNRLKIPLFSVVCDRFGIPDRPAALLATSLII